MVLQMNQAATVHVRFAGRSSDVPLERLGLEAAATDFAVKQAVARYLETPELELRDHVVDRHETGNLTVRPQAVFG